MANKRATPIERFWQYVDKTGTCWLWRGGLFSNGYGRHYVGRRALMAHRYSFQQLTGEIPEGMQVDHACHNRACVNPEHLRLATNKQNNENPAKVRSDNRHGFRGVGLNKKTGRYRSRVQHDGKEYRTGEHDTPEQAAEAARQLRLSLFTHNSADRALGDAPLVEFTTTESRRRNRKRIIPCAGTCGRMLRNHHVPLDEAPDLVAVSGQGMCRACQVRERKSK